MRSLLMIASITLITSSLAFADTAQEARRAANRVLRKAELCIVDPAADAKTSKNKEIGDLVFLRKCSKRNLNKANLEDLKQDVLLSTETLVTDGLQGPTGPQGPIGPQGPQGAPGTASFTNGYWQQVAPAMPPVGAPGVLMIGGGVNCNAANEIAVGPIVTHILGPAAAVGDIIPNMGIVNGVNVPVGYAATIVSVPAAGILPPGGLPIGPAGMQIGFWCIPQ